MAELPRLAGDPLRVASLADRAHDVGARPLDDERARSHLVARGTHDGPRLAGEDRFVERERVGSSSGPSATTWSPGAMWTRSPSTTSLDRELALLAVPHDRRPRRHEGREPVERPLRAQLLRDPDTRVRDDDREEESVAPVGEDERQDAERDAGRG